MRRTRLLCPPRLLKRLALGAFAFVQAIGAAPLFAQVSEQEIKAAYIYNFAKFVEWPEAARPMSMPFVVCHARLAPEFQSALAALEKRMLDGQSITLRPLGVDDRPKGCHILVLDDTERNLSRWIVRVAGLPVMVVANGESAARDGASIGFVAADSRIQFAVNTDALARSQLKAKAQLLKIATLVTDRR
jgi:hypothetical protein